MPSSPYWQAVWVVLEATIVVASVLAARSHRAVVIGRVAVGLLFLVGGAAFNTVFFATGGDYREFADSSYLAFVRDTWGRSSRRASGSSSRC